MTIDECATAMFSKARVLQGQLLIAGGPAEILLQATIRADLQSLVRSERAAAETAERERCVVVIEEVMKTADMASDVGGVYRLQQARDEILRTAPTGDA